MAHDIEMKYLKVKFDVHFKRTLAKCDNLDNQIQRCTKLMIIFDILLIINLFLFVAINICLI